MSLFPPSTSYNFPLEAAAAAGGGQAPPEIVSSRDPTTTDIYPVGQLWFSTLSSQLWVETAVSGGVATWSASAASITTPVTVPNGGTGAITLTAHGVLLGEGAAAIQATAAGTNGQVLVGSTGANPVFATLTSSDGSIVFTTGAGTLGLTANINIVNVTSVNHAASPYTVLGTDYFLAVDPTAGVVTITLPAAPATGRTVVVCDSTGQSAANNITISGNGKNISSGGASAASVTVATAYKIVTLYYNGTIWNASVTG